MKPVKIAMMALTHGHTRKYYQTLRENSKLDWVASCAADQRAKDVYELYDNGVPCYLSPEEMFEKHPDIEAVVIASANDQHLKEMKLCAERGVHILSMKIPSFDPKEYDEMIELVDKTGIVCQVELEMHYNPVVKRLQEIIASGRLGKLLSIQMTNITLSPVWAFPWQGVPEASYGTRVPLKDGDKRFRGGALCDHPHIFDLIRWLTGSDFDYVFSQVAPNIRPELEVEDMILATGKMKDGTAFLFDPSWSR
ncbi:MAG: Gfo/Idh/MocA family oxidoreductase, partial [Victivallales bacterium]|nr:Gfo/Idh/MocA family oxidoreductase [Victivallales bacterium]